MYPMSNQIMNIPVADMYANQMNMSSVIPQQQPSVGPQYIYDVNLICQSLGCRLSTIQILTLARDAVLKGYMLSEKYLFNNQACHQFIHQNMRFVISSDFLLVVSITYYHVQPQQPQQQQQMNQFIPQQTKQQINYKIIDDDVNENEHEIESMVDAIVSDIFDEDIKEELNENLLLLPPLPAADPLATEVSTYSDVTVSSQGSVEQMAKEPKREYHTIYLKPIIERMLMLNTNPMLRIDADYIIDIVDAAIKQGVKRQISKRTFEFKWMNYTVIMSKSLKTILDVSMSSNPNIITVHPDVVSIISKKCQRLNYFKIRQLAEYAKSNGSYVSKKNDYRQQFIYNFCGCRIVFASNHSTIVEMQCNDYSIMKRQLCL